MGFQEIAKPSLKELFVQQIVNMILSGELEIGSKLPSERELVEKLQVSRTVITAGITEMESIGFLEVRARQGVFVSDYRRKGTIDTLINIMRYNGGSLKEVEVRSILEIRIGIETLAARLAIDKASDEALASLKPYLNKIHDSIDPKGVASAVFEFYHELSILGENMLLPLLYYSFREPTIGIWKRYCELHGVNLLYERRVKLYEFLIKRDASGAEEWIKSYLLESINELKTFYSE